jgi:beta-glucanase (GH16 family)
MVFLLVALVLLVSRPVYASPPIPGNWQLVFADEFDGTSLDASKWIPCFPWAQKNSSGAVVGCSSTTTPNMYYLPENVVVQNGLLRLRAQDKRNEPTWRAPDGKYYKYTSGMVSTAGASGTSSYKYLFQYGYVEMRAKVPKGKGYWPALWSLYPEGTWPPEIDMLEILGHETHIGRFHYHYLDSNGIHRDSGRNYQSSGYDAANAFYTYGLYWSPSAIRWYIERPTGSGTMVEATPGFTDNVNIVPNTNNPDSRNANKQLMYLIANLQVGGSWPGEPDNTTVFPGYYDIDYIKVWQESSAPVPSPTPMAGDFDHDGDRDYIDLYTIIRNFSKTVTIFTFNSQLIWGRSL